MQLIHEQKPVIKNITSMNINLSTRNASSHNFEVKEKRSSDASLRLMNPVASGDNMAMDLNNQKLKEELPMLVPCCEGKELLINQDLVRSGLSAISMKHESIIQCLSMPQACDKTQLVSGLVKHRNSFRCLHRPDLKRVPYLRRMSPDELETLFRGYADLPSLESLTTDIEESSKITLTNDLNTRPEVISPNKINQESNVNSTLRTFSNFRPGTEELPVGMRLHGARAKLYTSVLAGTKAGDQLSNSSNTEDYDTTVPEIQVPEDEIQLNEELQIILPPRCEEGTEASIP